MPCGVPVTGIKLDPLTATAPVGDSHTVTATVSDSDGTPVAGVAVGFVVTSGPNEATTGSAVTDASGHATFTYSDAGGAGTDTIVATFHDSTGGLHTSNIATKSWVAATPPSCALTGVIAGPPKQLQITVQDSDDGLKSIEVTVSDNATVSVPPFAVGETGALVVTATKTNQTLGAHVALRVTDVNGNVTDCDPLIAGESSSSSGSGCNSSPAGLVSLIGLLFGLGLLRRRR